MGAWFSIIAPLRDSILFISIPINTQWLESPVTLPHWLDEAAVGFYGNEVHIIGGDRAEEYGRQRIRYNISSNKFVNDGQFVLSSSTILNGISQFYYQLDSILYMINDDTFSIYNISTQQFTTNWMDLHIPDNYNLKHATTNAYKQRSCLVATHEYLFVIGGSSLVQHHGTNRTHIFNRSTQLWSLLHMNSPRTMLSCALDGNKLYAIGGKDTGETSLLDSIELLNITKIKYEQASWTLLKERLGIAVSGTRAITDEALHRIFVIGGYGSYYGWNYAETSNVNVIDTDTGTVTYLSYVLPYAVSTTAAIKVRNTLYCFGGWRETYKVDTFIYYTLPTAAPITQPTSIPTAITASPITAIPITAAPITTTSLITSYVVIDEDSNDSNEGVSDASLYIKIGAFVLAVIVIAFVLILLIWWVCVYRKKRGEPNPEQQEVMEIDVDENHLDTELGACGANVDAEGVNDDHEEGATVEGATVGMMRKQMMTPMVVARDPDEELYDVFGTKEEGTKGQTTENTAGETIRKTAGNTKQQKVIGDGELHKDVSRVLTIK
eukprot:564104_1